MNFTVSVLPTPEALGNAAALKIAELLRAAVAEKGSARLVLSTGASQLETVSALTRCDVPWDKVEMFHLDEYVALPESHPASFRKYLKERFAEKVNLKAAYYVDGEHDTQQCIGELTAKIREATVDVGVIGIGENAHIAFNDPPADFETDAAYMVVELDERCKRQQVGEGWFAGIEDVPKLAITMTVKQILSCRHIVSCVPHAVKAGAVSDTLTKPVTANIPATILKTHPNWNLYLDDASASGLFHL